MRIGVFGGSFDPPHAAHLAVARAAFQQLNLDRILWVPALQTPHKDVSSTPFDHRIGMVRALVGGEPGTEVSEIESTLSSPSYTLHTLNALKLRMEGNHSWHLIIGADNWAIFQSWHQPESVLKEASLAVYPRQGFALTGLPTDATVLDCPEIAMESRQFRALLQSNPEWALAELPVSVASYIRLHRLYQ